jgi:hypothetical protein
MKDNHIADCDWLRSSGFETRPVGQSNYHIETEVLRDGQSTTFLWGVESAARYFPLEVSDSTGLCLHPLDSCVNKALALAGKVVIGEWLDVLTCHALYQNLGLLVYAATGKHQSRSPHMLLAEASRYARFSMPEYESILIDGVPPDPKVLGIAWRAALREAHEIIEILPHQLVGTAVLTKPGEPWRGTPEELQTALTRDELIFHPPAVGGCWPRIVA